MAIPELEQPLREHPLMCQHGVAVGLACEACRIVVSMRSYREVLLAAKAERERR